MIEKLNWEEQPENAAKEVQNLIDALVDAVNELQLTVSKMENLEHLKKIGQGFKNLQDPYAEQRKWIGSLVEYKLGDLFLYGILTDIKDGYTPPFVIDGTSYTDDCWLPDESVIYHATKGDDNE